MRLGGIETIKVDARIIAATNVDLKKLVEQGKFRDDLYYRLNVISVQLPPLRERKEDIPLLADHFVRKFCEENNKSPSHIPLDVLKLLLDYHWPGNVRELENVIERAVVLTSSTELSRELIPDGISAPKSKVSLEDVSIFNGRSLFEIMDSFEKKESVNWSQTEAAEKFGVPLSTLNSKVKRLAIDIKKRTVR